MSEPGKANQGNRSLGPACPHCLAPAEIRTSRAISRTVREYYHHCTDPECGHTFVSHWSVVRTLSPSNAPHPAVHLPISPRRAPIRRQPAPANDNAARPTNDNPPSVFA